MEFSKLQERARVCSRSQSGPTLQGATPNLSQNTTEAPATVSSARTETHNPESVNNTTRASNAISVDAPPPHQGPTNPEGIATLSNIASPSNVVNNSSATNRSDIGSLPLNSTVQPTSGTSSASRPEGPPPQILVTTPTSRRAAPTEQTVQNDNSNNAGGSVNGNPDHMRRGCPNARQILDDLESSPELTEFIQQLVIDSFNDQAEIINKNQENFNSQIFET